MSWRQAALARYRTSRFALLFYTLLFALGIHPIMALAFPEVDFGEWLLALNLAAAFLSIELGRRSNLLRYLAGGFVVARLAHPVLGLPAILSVSQALWIGAICVVIVQAARHAFRPGHTVSERVYSALDAYLLAGFAFGAAFWLLEREVPGSFGSTTALTPLNAVYMSFFTLTTLGLPGGVPSNGAAKGLMILEALGGQIYLTVLVARLVSLYSREEERSR
jgi:ion channel